MMELLCHIKCLGFYSKYIDGGKNCSLNEQPNSFSNFYQRDLGVLLNQC